MFSPLLLVLVANILLSVDCLKVLSAAKRFSKFAMVKVGDSLPTDIAVDVIATTLDENDTYGCYVFPSEDFKTIFSRCNKAVLFAVPGAFTPVRYLIIIR